MNWLSQPIPSLVDVRSVGFYPQPMEPFFPHPSCEKEEKYLSSHKKRQRFAEQVKKPDNKRKTSIGWESNLISNLFLLCWWGEAKKVEKAREVWKTKSHERLKKITLEESPRKLKNKLLRRLTSLECCKSFATKPTFQRMRMSAGGYAITVTLESRFRMIQLHIRLRNLCWACASLTTQMSVSGELKSLHPDKFNTERWYGMAAINWARYYLVFMRHLHLRSPSLTTRQAIERGKFSKALVTIN